MSAVFGAYGRAPSGQPDTYTTHRMRAALRPSQEAPSTAEQAWAAMHPIARQQLVLAACGPMVGALHLKAWHEIEPKHRLMIGSAARQRAACLL